MNHFIAPFHPLSHAAMSTIMVPPYCYARPKTSYKTFCNAQHMHMFAINHSTIAQKNHTIQRCYALRMEAPALHGNDTIHHCAQCMTVLMQQAANDVFCGNCRVSNRCDNHPPLRKHMCTRQK